MVTCLFIILCHVYYLEIALFILLLVLFRTGLANQPHHTLTCLLIRFLFCIFYIANFILNFQFPWSRKQGGLEGALKPLVADTTNHLSAAFTQFLMGLCAVYAYCMVDERLKNKDIQPESEEGNFPSVQDPSVSQEQNVKFINTHPGYKTHVDGGFDALRDDALATDASLDEFFSRPIRISTYNWQVDSDFFQTFNPWSMYMENPRVMNRLANYRLMRCKLHVRFTINGNGFYYGRALCSYNPFPNDDTLTAIRQFFPSDLVEASQRPHVFLDPTNSQGGDLELPFFTYENVLDIVTQTWQNMGTVNIKSMQDLKHANGANVPVTINVFAWAEDVKFAIPTQFEPASISPQADEYGMKPISRIAGAVAKMAGMLSSAPAIGPFARATEIGAQALGAIATLFGYSKPQILECEMFIPRTKTNLAVTNTPEDSTKLTMDVKQELSIDPRTAGLGSDDELSINYIASRESYLCEFPWPIGAVQETLLWNGVVDPGITNLDDAYHLPALAFATMPFKYWRGTLKYRFQIVCSAFHKGRLKIVYDPVGTPPVAGVSPTQPSAEYNTAYTTIVDIADNTDFTIDVGWGQNTTYREHLGIPQTIVPYDTEWLGYTSSTVPFGNGTIAVYVVNELTTPNSAVPYDIAINVFVSAGYGFEVAGPTNEYVGRMRVTEPLFVARDEFLPESSELMVEMPDSIPTNPQLIDSMAETIDSNDAANLVYFGERVSSFRQLLKRYNLVEIAPAADPPAVPAGTQSNLEIHRYNLPLVSGYYPNSTTASSVVEVVNGGRKYVYGFNNILNYTTLAFAGWKGGVRYFIDASTTVATGTSTTTVDRLQDPVFPSNTLQEVGDQILVGPKGNIYNSFRGSSGMSGTAMQATNVNPTLSFEVPYYSRYRFAPAKRMTTFDVAGANDPDPFQNGWVYRLKGPAHDEGASLYIYASAAEDFTTFFFLGCPRIFVETTFPVA